MPRTAAQSISRPLACRGLLWALFAATLLAALGPIAGTRAQDGPAPEPAPDKPAEEPKPPTLNQKLGGDERYSTHLSTDKPIYRAGEIVYVRGTILHAFKNTPIDDQKAALEKIGKEIEALGRPENDADRQKLRELFQRRSMLLQQTRIVPMIEIKDPKGATITSGQAQVQDSVFGFSWEVPQGQAGGEYAIKVTHPWSGLAPAERTFDIRAYRPPRIRSQIDFTKDGYGPGDTVTATIEATRAEGGVPENAKVTAIARVDGSEVARVETTMAASGTAQVSFELPDTITRGEGSLAFVIQDGGVVETASKTLPILLQTVDLSLYPEGGDLVEDQWNRVYFEARTPYGKPADIKGQIVTRPVFGDQAENTPWEPVAGVTVETRHEGRGVFKFKPETGKAYALRVTEPSSVTEVFELPDAVAQGISLSVPQGVIPAGEPVTVSLDGLDLGRGGKVIIRQRERILAEQVYQFLSGVLATRPGETNSNEAVFAMNLPETASGILTVTVHDAEGKPLAERLVYRAPKDHVTIEILPDSARYTPAGKVQLTIKTIGADGKPVSAVAGLTVTDDSVLEMIETREQAPSLPAMVFLEQEVEELADAHVYLDPDNADAAEQLDLLLGTQGWRRFALVNLEQFVLEHGDDARRMLAMRRPVEIELRKARAEVAFAARGGGLDDDEADFAVEELQEAAPGAVANNLGGIPDPQAEPPQPQQGQQGNQQAAEEPIGLDEALGQAAERREREALIAGDIAPNFQRRRRMSMVYIREYAHKQPAGKPFGERSDFTETVYWSAATKTDANGVATVEFDLSDSVTSFRVKADAFTPGGALGAGSELIESVRPFYVEPKLPLELTAGDTVLLPIAMINNTNRELPVGLSISKLGQAGETELDPIALGADTRGRTLYELAIGETYGELAFSISARAGNLFDQNKRSLRVVPKGFPIKDGSGGMLQPDSEINDEITIPESIVPGSLSATITVYPTPMANLTEALEALIRDPYGCFEQTSSTTFPLVMAQQYFMSHQGIDPALIAKAREKLDKGYQRLIGFETEQKGYEWFGSTPPHEALTAYGLLQFNEMKAVMDVDQAMIDRTADWLMSRRDGKGSFKLDSKALDSFGRAPQETTNAYIVWSMLEAGYDPAKIEAEIDAVLKQATEGNDAYIIALGANIAQLAADATTVLKLEDKPDPAQARKAQYLGTAIMLRDKLAKQLTDEGFIDGAVTSITRSGGDALRIEATSLAILAWLYDDKYTGQVEQAILWLTERCKAGRFGSTQSTVLALKAIVEYDKARSTPKAPGELVLIVDGEPFGEPVAFDKETRGAIKLPDIADKLTPGKHTIAVLMDGGSKMPYTIAVEYHANTPASSEECALRIETLPPAPRPGNTVGPDGFVVVGEGELTEINVKVTNVTKEGLPTPIAIVGVPGGLEPDYDQLKELVAAGTIASFEVIGRDVVLYWREMKPEQVVELPIRCTAAVPGTYTGPASRAYLYYTDEFKHWTDGLGVTIMPRKAE